MAEIDFVHASSFQEGDRFDGEKTPDKLTPAKAAPKLALPETDQSKDDSSQSSLSRAESDEDIEDSSPQTPAEGDDLLGQIVEKELLLKTQGDMVAKLKEELAKYRTVEAASEEFAKVGTSPFLPFRSLSKPIPCDNQEKMELTQKLNDALFRLEKQTHEHREEVMSFETFHATNQSLTVELNEAKVNPLSLSSSRRAQLNLFSWCSRLALRSLRRKCDRWKKTHQRRNFASRCKREWRVSQTIRFEPDCSQTVLWGNTLIFFFHLSPGRNCHERERNAGHTGKTELEGWLCLACTKPC